MSDSDPSSKQRQFSDFAADTDNDDSADKTEPRSNSDTEQNVKVISPPERSVPDVDELPEMTGSSFNEYWFKRNAERNLEENHPERNDPSHSWPIGRFEPHQLGNCKRQWFYHWLNAPKEEQDPHGIFAIGHFIEEDIIEPWLHDLFEPTYEIDNAIHVSVDIGTVPVGEDADTDVSRIAVPESHGGDDDGEDQLTGLHVEIPETVGYNQPDDTEPVLDSDSFCLTVAGSTDPAICDPETGDVIALTEVKSTGSIDRVTSPKRMHLLQIHAYMKALGITDGYVIYVDRDGLLDPKVFEVTFDEDVWQRVVDWVEGTVQYALYGELPPADAPEHWMCNYCEYRNRCGEGRSNLGGNMGVRGFVPGYTGYPRNMVEDHLEAYDEVELTPSLALLYPDLADEYGVEEWKCPECTATFDYTDSYFDKFTNTEFETPKCPACREVFDRDVFLQTDHAIR